MRFWPFGKQLEQRNESYTDALINALVTRASGDATGSHTAVREIVSGLVGKSLCQRNGRGC